MTGSRITDHVGPNDYSIVRDLENLEKPKKDAERSAGKALCGSIFDLPKTVAEVSSGE